MPRVTIDLVRSVQWGASYLWDFIIDDNEFPLDWVPAVDVEEVSSIVESETISGGQTSFKVPKNSGVKQIKLTFVDDINHSVYTYFEKWMNEITVANNEYVATLEECSKLIQIKRLDTTRVKTVKQSVYWVYPEGDLTFNGNSESSGLQYSVSLVVVGNTTASKTYASEPEPRSLSYRDISIKKLFDV